MRRTRMLGWSVATLALGAALTVPAGLWGQVSADPETAAALEAEAARLHDQKDHWADAASLYKAAADLRQHEDPVARQDLFLAANLLYQAGDMSGAMTALEAAGRRALSSGDSVLAAQMFANAALVANQAGLTNDERRLRMRATELASASTGRGPVRG
jgi:tetratricopeptide (TPR) repeat protein